MQGAVAYDAVEKTESVDTLLRARWHRQFEEEFMNPDGSIVALRSAISECFKSRGKLYAD